MWLVEGEDISWTQKHLFFALLDYLAMKKLDLGKE
jgi:hypothetical protein